MKKIVHVLILFIYPFLSAHCLAYISGKTVVAEKKIYCPKQVVCSENSNVNSCRPISDTPQYWGQIQAMYGGPSIGVYDFSEVIGDYHNASMGIRCSYIREGNEIRLSSKRESNLEIYYDKSTKWNINFGTGSCQSNDPSLCPLKEASGVGISIIDENPNYGITFTINNVYFDRISSGDRKHYFLSYEDAQACWSEKQCKIDVNIVSKDIGRIVVGTLIVDMDNKMKILKILPNEISGVNLNQIESFNTIGLKKSDAPVDSSIEIANYLMSEIYVYVNNSNVINEINRNANGKIYSYRIVEACQNKNECKVDLKEYNKGLIGSVVVDMKNNMNILSVQSTRSSEIMVNKVNAYKVEVSYPNKK